MRGPEPNLFCRTAELKAAVNERVPSEHALRTSGGAPNPATVAAEQAFMSAVEEVFGRCITTVSPFPDSVLLTLLIRHLLYTLGPELHG